MSRPSHWIRALAAAFALVMFAGCRQEPPPSRVECPTLSAPAPAFSVEAAREAHRRAEEARTLRYREAVDPGYFLRVSRKLVSQKKIEARQVCLDQLVHVGRLLFEHEYSFVDGLGRDDASTRADPFRRVHAGALGGPETQSCSSCHWRGGPAGAGVLVDNSLIEGDGINVDSADARNPPALQGSGVAQALAQEMSQELQNQLAMATIKARNQGAEVWVALEAKGIGFGKLRVDAAGVVGYEELRGVDQDLVIKPFGWRGEFATLRDFVAESTQVHLGLQSEELVASRPASELGNGPDRDPDGDGIEDELSTGLMTALVLYLATLEMPRVLAPDVLREAEAAAEGLAAPLAHSYYDRFAEGQRLFSDIGCVMCHTPMMVLKNPIFVTRTDKGARYEVDLSKEGIVHYDPSLGGYPVWSFSDFRRHDLGEGIAAQHVPEGLASGEFLSRRLWGLADSPPYFYDGRAPSLDMAIEAHGGEGSFAREEFAELTSVEKGSLRLYLLSLRRSPSLVVP